MAIVKQVEIECEVKVITEKALLIYDGKQEVWIAKSQITDETEERGGPPASSSLSGLLWKKD